MSINNLSGICLGIRPIWVDYFLTIYPFLNVHKTSICTNTAVKTAYEKFAKRTYGHQISIHLDNIAFHLLIIFY